jgi:hypothetical protein
MLEHYNTTASVKAVANLLGDINRSKEILPEIETMKKLEDHGPNMMTIYATVGTSVKSWRLTKLLKGTRNEEERIL